MERGGARPVRKSFHESMEVDEGTKPRVNDLKNFFEKLTEKSEAEMIQMSPQRRHSKGAGLTRGTIHVRRFATRLFGKYLGGGGGQNL